MIFRIGIRVLLLLSWLHVCFADIDADTNYASFNVLPRLNIDTTDVTVSGMSAGGAMAHQLHVIYSSLFSGAAIFAGAPYDCSGGRLSKVSRTCQINDPPISISSLIDTATSRANAGQIDSLTNLSNARVYLYSGTLDKKVYPVVVQSVQQFYAKFVGSGGVINFENNVSSVHTFPTNNPKVANSCTDFKPPYIGNCHYEGAGIALQTILSTPLKTKGNFIAENLYTFPQLNYIPQPVNSSADVGLATTGYIYIPNPCLQNITCKLHVALHGCGQQASSIGTTFISDTEWVEWASSNLIVIIFPQTNHTTTPDNIDGCWDWWGYSGDNFDVHGGKQIEFLKNITLAVINGGPTWNEEMEIESEVEAESD